MKKQTLWFALVIFFFSCADKDSGRSESDIDAARNFVRASLDNDIKKARSYMIQDSANNEYLDLLMGLRANRPKQENQRYKEASIRIHDTRKLNDSVSIINYSNSFINAKDSLKVVRTDNQWLVDLKFSFSKNENVH